MSVLVWSPLGISLSLSHTHIGLPYGSLLIFFRHFYMGVPLHQGQQSRRIVKWVC